MLNRLHIENLAIIERCEIEFEPGLNILTGETGAGKSIIVGALNLVLGERASSDDVRTGAAKARVEAEFSLGDAPAVRKALAERGLAGEDANLLLVRREIQAEGKSRHFINGASVQLAEVRAITGALVDLHGQHQHQSLLDSDSHREALDAYGGHGDLLEQCARAYHEFTEAASELRSLLRDERQAERDRDMLKFQIEEIEGAKLEPGEDERFEIERNRLANAEMLSASARAALDQLYEGEHTEAPAIQLLSGAQNEIENLARLDPTLKSLGEALGSARAAVEDAANELRAYSERIEADPARLQEVEDRLNLIRKLKRKYGDTIEAILAEAAACRQRLDNIEHRDERVAETRRRLEQARAAFAGIAHDLSVKRQAAAKRWTREIEKRLAELSMPNTRCEVALTRVEAAGAARKPGKSEKLGQSDASDRSDQSDQSDVSDASFIMLDGRAVQVGPTGADQVELLISPNPGEELRPLRKIASGGELSRIMLALKTIMAARDRVPTLIFDEVDAGISGAAAARVGEKIEALARHHQIICITHLPQIAARRAAHFTVEKKTQSGRTIARARRLSEEERHEEIASLFSGDHPTPESREHARAMLEGRKS
ncbi:MAG: DNA repair protein RecN [Candidatus Sumerlaeota bacterium]|nr:DNA repair protein RecN [Candidatus Sumerlaeota bacterium]